MPDVDTHSLHTQAAGRQSEAARELITFSAMHCRTHCFRHRSRAMIADRQHCAAEYLHRNVGMLTSQPGAPQQGSFLRQQAAAAGGGTAQQAGGPTHRRLCQAKPR